ncbi:MAG: hypothetical protein COU90_01680 [Candidatus Ryanbacteria bacterium CG10_big_fil_rev_8_21_14_0_10_43_42]|uniref:PpiC domain-containing protein n=1 Tax=Candidatus Ryanbacteria bacterium CG10_big_fil_rev_8_21_14_0_10_43_42 TaxID=1974864 RepID=A0A2M8KXB9_9BACT|nr:MAG: hypothetical protein COU90_01680 [Candidatus Ryanbacteria bacterium CG10_big_fil_rev_8_21_14_0_10_43_42]
MKRSAGVILVIVAIFGLGLFFTGLYPVARINEDIVLRRTFSERAKALIQFENRTRSRINGAELTEDEQRELERVVLENLIINTVLTQYIRHNFTETDLFIEAELRVEEALSSADADVLPRATSELYGWSVDEFKKNVLFPQALMTVLEERVSVDNSNFKEFVREQLVYSDVSLYLIPWKWQNGEVVER